MVVVYSASVQEPAGGLLVLQRLFDQFKHNVHNRWRRLKLLWARGAYAAITAPVQRQFDWILEIVRPKAGQKGSKVLPR